MDLNNYAWTSPAKTAPETGDLHMRSNQLPLPSTPNVMAAMETGAERLERKEERGKEGGVNDEIKVQGDQRIRILNHPHQKGTKVKVELQNQNILELLKTSVLIRLTIHQGQILVQAVR